MYLVENRKIVVTKKKKNTASTGKYETNRRVGEGQSCFIFAKIQQKIVSLLFSINRIKSFLVFRGDMRVREIQLSTCVFCVYFIKMLSPKKKLEKEKIKGWLKKKGGIKREKFCVEKKKELNCTCSIYPCLTLVLLIAPEVFIILAENDKDRQ